LHQGLDGSDHGRGGQVGERLQAIGDGIGVGEDVFVRQRFPCGIELDARQQGLQIVEESFLRFQAVGDHEDGTTRDLREQGDGERLCGIGHRI